MDDRTKNEENECPIDTADSEVFHPGCARLGNFINYYRFNPTENRTKLIPRDIVRKNVAGDECLSLDIGCNSGVRR
jgi:hypothetical protein